MALATGSTCGNRSAACPRRADVRLGGRPLAAKGKDLGGAGVGPSQVERTVDVLRQADRQLGVRDGRVPVAPAEMGVTQMGHTRTRIGRRQAGAQPSRRHTEVGDRPGQVVDVDLQHAPHDQGVGFEDWYFAPRDGQKAENSEPFGATAGRGERVRLRGACHGPQRRVRNRPATARSAHTSAWSGRPDMTIQLANDVAARAPIQPFALWIMGLPRSEQAILGTGRSGEDSKKSGQGVATSAGRLTGGQDSGRRRGVGSIEVDDRGVEQSTLSVLHGRRAGRRLFSSPRRGTQFSEAKHSPEPMLRTRWPAPRLDQAMRRPDGPVAPDR